MVIQYVGTSRREAVWQFCAGDVELTFRTAGDAGDTDVRAAGLSAAASLTQRTGLGGLMASRWLAQHAGAIRSAAVARKPATLYVDALS